MLTTTEKNALVSMMWTHKVQEQGFTRQESARLLFVRWLILRGTLIAGRD